MKKYCFSQVTHRLKYYSNIITRFYTTHPVSSTGNLVVVYFSRPAGASRNARSFVLEMANEIIAVLLLPRGHLPIFPPLLRLCYCTCSRARNIFLRLLKLIFLFSLFLALSRSLSLSGLSEIASQTCTEDISLSTLRR